MVPSLTAGSINRILDGEDVSGANIQILGCKKIRVTGNDRYQLLISDGVTGCPFVLLGTKLNSLVTNKELEKFTIVRVDKCVCIELQRNRKIILLLNLAVLVPGTEVNHKIGNPTIAAAAAPGGAAENNQVNSNNNMNPSFFAGEPNVGNPPQMNGSVQSVYPIASLTPYQNKWTLTAGSINRILAGEDVSGAVIQILGHQKIPGTVGDLYRLLISDGVTGCPFVMLGTHLNRLVTNKELEKFTIIRVDKCVCGKVQPDRKVVILLNLAVLVPGSEVNERIGNPTSATAPGGTAENNQVNGNNNENRSVSNNNESRSVFAGESNVGMYSLFILLHVIFICAFNFIF